jgi:adenylosuccinate synthase
MQTKAILVADLGFGDAGKGGLVDYLTRETGAHTVMRYNGGAQAAHNVVTPEGRHHTFAQFGSGSFLPGTRTYLSRFMLLDPLAMLVEERALQAQGIRDAFARASIDRQALVTTPFQAAANRIKEIARGNARHGSCGMGVGETMSDWLAYGAQVPLAADLGDRRTLARKLAFLREAKLAQLEDVLSEHGEHPAIREELKIFYSADFIDITAQVYGRFASQVSLVDETFLRQLCSRPGTILFEGAQGVLLDEWYGFYPYNTWSTTTFKNAETLLAEGGFNGERFRLGTTRAYTIRHGAGPFMSESRALTRALPDRHNGDNRWQQTFRVGHLDLVALRYALKATGLLDGLAVTNLDRLAETPDWYACDRYAYNGSAKTLEDFFITRGGWITDIRLPLDPEDLSRQQTLTGLLFDMQPGLRSWLGNLNGFAESIAGALNVPLAITSYGPTAREKRSHIAF